MVLTFTDINRQSLVLNYLVTEIVPKHGNRSLKCLVLLLRLGWNEVPPNHPGGPKNTKKCRDLDELIILDTKNFFELQITRKISKSGNFQKSHLFFNFLDNLLGIGKDMMDFSELLNRSSFSFSRCSIGSEHWRSDPVAFGEFFSESTY